MISRDERKAAGKTLRENLGLRRPPNKFLAARQQIPAAANQ